MFMLYVNPDKYFYRKPETIKLSSSYNIGMEIPKAKMKIMPFLLLAIAAATVGAGQIGKNKVYACALDDISSFFGGIGTSPHYQGQQDGIWDHSHGLVYNPVGQCSTCTGDDFARGYSDGWNSYQSQESTQGAEVDVVNSPGAEVNVGQSSGQSQGPSGCSDDNCGGGTCTDCGSPSVCDSNCGQPTVCDFGCGLPYHHFGYWHHFWFHHEGPFGFGFHHMGFGGTDQ
jgi:hypothetical protein